MQAKRQAILDYLKENGQATVDELAEALGGLTTVTVRHHLDILRGEGLVSDPMVRHREARGRPQHVFALTAKASTHFPKGYDDLAAKVLAEVRAHDPQIVNVIFEGVAARISAEAPPPVTGESFKTRLDRAVSFLNERGYVARWENTPEGYIVHTCNCPYESLAGSHPELCSMDMVLIGNLLGVVPQRLSRVADGATSCAYLFKEK
ncbi:MAG: helix-turn-helix transcriptional regulator [Anaerolineales bacterium]